jgi:hypothetical protein
MICAIFAIAIGMILARVGHVATIGAAVAFVSWMRAIRSNRYKQRISRKSTVVAVAVCDKAERDQLISRLVDWCEICNITLVRLDGPVFRKLPHTGRILVADDRLPAHLYFLTKSDAILYKLAF